MSYIPQYSMRELLEAGAHYGHKRNYWNPKMARYIYGMRNGMHIVDLQQTVSLLNKALEVLKETASRNGRILFVGTKKAASEVVAEQASRCGQYYVNHRWLGGMLTNFSTISASIKTLQNYEETLADEESGLNKKERLEIDRKRLKLDNVLGGIRNMGGKPDLVFVIDTNQEEIAIQEARKLNIPVIAIVDTNSNPDNIDYIIPGNDDARKSIEIFTRLAADAILAGIQDGMLNSGMDVKVTSELKIREAANSEMPSEAAMKAEKEEGSKAKAGAKKKAPAPAKKAAPKVEPKKKAEVVTKVSKKKETKKA